MFLSLGCQCAYVWRRPPRVRMEWRDGGGRTRLVGVTELGRILGTHPNLALSVPEGLGRWEAGRSAAGMDPQRKGSGSSRDRAGETSSSSTTTTTNGGRTPPPEGPQPPPPRPPRKTPASSRVARKTPPPPSPAEQAQGQGQAPGQGQGQSHPPPTPRPPHCKIGVWTPMGMCRVWGTPGLSLGRRGAMGDPSAK